MNQPELHKKLIAAARSVPSDDRVPFAFEKRIMARLAGKAPQDILSLWGSALSRAAICCVVFVLLLSAGSYFLPAGHGDSIPQDLEQTIFAAVDNNGDTVGDL
jgi:hypothetical protein